jgi:uncharacterized membrane protein (DUF4010 family)
MCVRPLDSPFTSYVMIIEFIGTRSLLSLVGTSIIDGFVSSTTTTLTVVVVVEETNPCLLVR